MRRDHLCPLSLLSPVMTVFTLDIYEVLCSCVYSYSVYSAAICPPHFLHITQGHHQPPDSRSHSTFVTTASQEAWYLVLRLMYYCMVAEFLIAVATNFLAHHRTD